MRPHSFPITLCTLLVCLFGAGCAACRPCPKSAPADLPNELAKTSLPPYIIEPPDILLIDAVRVVPLPPYKIEPLDVLLIQVTDTLPKEPIGGLYPVEPDGLVNLGPSYGTVRVAGMTTDEARAAIDKQLRAVLKDPRVTVSLAQSRALQQIRGEHLVRPDGTVGLGTHGSVFVAGLTLDQAKEAIEEHLSKSLLQPEVSVDVYAYNSKVFYVVMDGAGYGQQVFRLPITGNETVLDAISQLNGLSPVSSKKRIWIARPSTDGECNPQVLAVNWKAITECGSSRTNYQLYPGDRVYVQADGLITFDNLVAKILSPVERVLGVTLLGQQTILSFDRSLRRGSGGFGLGF